jgi:PiT family inorganic phosphate transporter
VITAAKLVRAFSGKGLIPDSLVGTPQVLIAAGSAAAITILLATLVGMPTSTTHALTGALIGIGIAASATGTVWATLFRGFAIPLLLSPFIGISLAAVFYLTGRRAGSAVGLTRETCLCLEAEPAQPVTIQRDGTAVLASSGLALSIDNLQNCVERYQGRFIGVDAQHAMEGMHYLSAGAVCFGRAVNDTPKIAAVALATGAMGSSTAVAWVTVAMIGGGLLNSRRVAETMSKRITHLSPGKGLAANLATAMVVLWASQLGLPVSTTHVSCGSIFGIGLINRTSDWKTIAKILTAWVTTLPVAAVLSFLSFVVIRRLS